VKEVQQLTGRMAALSRFLSASGDKGYPYFQCLKKNNRFTWNDECERAFVKLNEYLVGPPVLGKPIPGIPIRYFSITNWAISSVIFQDYEKIQKSIYFVSKVLQGPETRYQAIKKAALAVVFTTRRLRHYFQSFIVIIMIDLPIVRYFKSPTSQVGWFVGQWSCLNSTYNMNLKGPSKAKYMQILW